MMSNLQVRILSAAIYFPLLFLSAYDLQLFALVMSFCLAVAWHEFLRFRFAPSDRAEWVRHGLKIFLGVIPVLFVCFGYSFSVGLGMTLVGYQILVIKSLTKGGTLQSLREDLGYETMGLLYLTGLFSLLVVSQHTSGGPEPIWFIFLVVGAADSGAYFAGRAFGKSPFFQNISPKKTLEGFMGGVVAGAVMAVLFRMIFCYFHFNAPGYVACLTLGIMVSVVSAFGDLFESMLKRHFKVKDSGALIPGHGGILDRLDGVIFAAVPIFFFVIMRGGFR